MVEKCKPEGFYVAEWWRHLKAKSKHPACLCRERC